MSPTQVSNYDDLKAQAELFDLEVDWDTLQLVPKGELPDLKSPWLKRWIYNREDKQWDHETQNKDGGR